ncbi:MAG TPA: hypothetical protein ENN17_05915 [bacterium]|nr:hypothetical protein [bacterium]
MKTVFKKETLFELHRMREKCKARDFRSIFLTPSHLYLFVILVLRALIIRLIPSRTTMYFIRKPIDSLNPVRHEPGYVFKTFDRCSDEIIRFAEARSSENKDLIGEIYLDILKNRFQKGVLACSLLNDKNDIVSIFFTSNQSTFIEQVREYFEPEDLEIIIADIYTLKEYRRKGLYLILLNHAGAYYLKQGFKSFVMWIMKHNRATVMAQLKAGFTSVFQTVRLFSWFGISKVSYNKTVIPLDRL